MPDYEDIYRQMHPRRFPFSAFERQRQLRDLWECDQKEFKRSVDVILAHEKER